jgi:imidazole glycerol-phosphate synthase subunit HisH
VRVALIDYGAGNLTSVRKGCAAAGLDVDLPSSPRALDRATGIVIPGVGHFSSTAAISDEWRDALRRRIAAGVPVLGLCLGMQWLFEGSAEWPEAPGLGVFSGMCFRLQAASPLKVPHVGWNTLDVVRDSAALGGVRAGSYVYFAHSFAAPATSDCAATTTHGRAFAAVADCENVWGVQFHPEKSSEAGLQILRNFARLVRG